MLYAPLGSFTRRVCEEYFSTASQNGFGNGWIVVGPTSISTSSGIFHAYWPENSATMPSGMKALYCCQFCIVILVPGGIVSSAACAAPNARGHKSRPSSPISSLRAALMLLSLLTVMLCGNLKTPVTQRPGAPQTGAPGARHILDCTGYPAINRIGPPRPAASDSDTIEHNPYELSAQSLFPTLLNRQNSGFVPPYRALKLYWPVSVIRFWPLNNGTPT